ncbi:BamA/TamA family outer membrane protein [bacterium]|nr:BamA/TamA family outer membrane protein [bacterium]
MLFNNAKTLNSKKPSNLFGGFFIIIFCILSVSFPANLDAQKVADVVINGNRSLSDNEIKRILKLQEKTLFDNGQFETRLDSLSGLYQKLGYLNFTVSVQRIEFNSDSSKVEIALNINEGKKAVIQELRLVEEKPSSIGERIEKTMDLKKGADFDGFLLEDDMKRILDFLEDYGYPFAKLSLTDFIIDDKIDKPEVIVEITVDKGPRVEITFVEVRGNDVTGAEYFPRLMRLKLPSLYSEKSLESGLKLLRRTPFFSTVSKPKLIQNPFDKWGIVINVKERAMNSVNGIIGYSPGIAGESGELYGTAELTMKNLWGTCRGLHLRWISAGSQGREILVEYREPWFLRTAVELNGSFLETKQDSSYTEYDWEISSIIPVGRFTSFNAGLGLKEVVPESVGTYIFNIPKSSTFTLSTGFEINMYDRAVNPKSGGAFRSDFSLMDKRRDGPDFVFTGSRKKHVFQLGVDCQSGLAILLFPSQVLFTSLNWKSYLVSGVELPLSDLYRVGGSRSVRGYKEQQFAADKVGWSNIEYRLLLGPGARVFAFADIAWFEKSAIPDVKVGWGVGLRFESNIGLIGVDYGIGEDRTVTSGIIHFSIEAEF